MPPLTTILLTAVVGAVASLLYQLAKGEHWDTALHLIAVTLGSAGLGSLASTFLTSLPASSPATYILVIVFAFGTYGAFGRSDFYTSLDKANLLDHLFESIGSAIGSLSSSKKPGA